jgi:hypothetical protein
LQIQTWKQRHLIFFLVWPFLAGVILSLKTGNPNISFGSSTAWLLRSFLYYAVFSLPGAAAAMIFYKKKSIGFHFLTILTYFVFSAAIIYGVLLLKDSRCGGINPYCSPFSICGGMRMC